MKSKLVLVLWCINLCSKLAASIPFYEDSAQHIVGAQQASRLLSNVQENKNAHSQLENLVALSHSFNPDVIYPSGIGSIEQQQATTLEQREPTRSIEQQQATTLEQRGPTRWHALTRARAFPSAPQDLEATYQALPMPYRGRNFTPGAPMNQLSSGQPQTPLIQQHSREPSNASTQLPFIRQPSPQRGQQPPVRQRVEEQSNQLHFIRRPEKVQLQFIRHPEEAESIQQYPAQRYEGPSNVESSRQPIVPLNQQLYRQPLAPRPFVPFRAENVERPFGKPEEIITDRQLFTKYGNYQQLQQPQQSTGLPPGMNNLQQIAASNELQKVAGSKPKSRYIVVYPNGTVEYVNQLETVAKKYPNYMMLNGYNAVTNSNTPPQNIAQQTQNFVGKPPSNPAQYDTVSLESQVRVNDKKQIQHQNNVVQTQTENDENVNDVPETETLNHSWLPKPIDSVATTGATISTEIVSFPSEIEVRETGPDGSNIVVTKEIEILNTSYSTSKSSETQSTKSTYQASEENNNQTTQAESQSNHDIYQSQDLIKANSQLSYEPEEEDTIVHTETTFTLSESQSQEQSESNFLEDDHSDKEQQQTQTSQEQTQSSTKSPTQSASSTQQTQNESTTSSQAPTDNSAFSSSESNSTSELATSKPSQTESATNSQTQTQKNESSSNAPDLALSKPSLTGPVTNDTNEDQGVTKTAGEAQNMATTANDNSTGSSTTTENDNSASSTESQRKTQSQSNSKPLSNATSDAEAKPYTWFSTQDPDFFEKLMGNDKLVGVVYFFMVPSNTTEYPE